MSPLPIARPGKVIAVGLNYRDHAAETGQELPTSPMLFAKWPTCLIGHGDAIVLPTLSDKVDFEAELGVVIGRGGRGIGSDDALDHVAGYICANDVSARDLQRADKQYSRAKSLDTFGPVGPRLVPASEIPDPQALRIRAILNGQVMQDSSTAGMVFGVRELIAFISEGITLEPGDLIVTGTPAGVGFARDPRVFLQPGDTITVEIEGVGELTNPVVAPR
jgi:2-keto-4-pentenoate hydratase/2-oxohepta-3-ene-1,7-dioic acid hydratase in catechol pathway